MMEQSTCCANWKAGNKWSKKRGLQDSGLLTFTALLFDSGTGSFHNRTTLLGFFNGQVNLAGLASLPHKV